jgi:hypothetical protein
MNIVDWEYGVDLRDITHREEAINAAQAKYELKDDQAVAFFNNSRWFGGAGYHPPKVRLYYRVKGRTMLLCPAIRRSGDMVDFMHDFSRWLRDEVTGGDQIDGLDEIITEMEERAA